MENWIQGIEIFVINGILACIFFVLNASQKKMSVNSFEYLKNQMSSMEQLLNKAVHEVTEIKIKFDNLQNTTNDLKHANKEMQQKLHALEIEIHTIDRSSPRPKGIH
jgi:septation ring formation regulator EzrA